MMIVIRQMSMSPPEDPVPEETVAEMNRKWLDHIKVLAEPRGVQNLTVVEPLESRSQQGIAKTASRIVHRYKAMGVVIHGVHTDRESAFASRTFQAFCRQVGPVEP